MKKKFLAVFLALSLMLSLVPTALATEGEATEVDLSQGSCTITEAGKYAVKEYTGTNTLTIKADATVTLNGVDITAPEGASAISIEKGNVTLNIAADSTLIGGKGGAGIYVAEGASVTITGTGKLTAIGNAGEEDTIADVISTKKYTKSGAAGIGGKGSTGSGKITIESANVEAYGYGLWASGIGSAGGYADDITIIDSKVAANGGFFADGDGSKLHTNWGKDDPEGGVGIGGGSKGGAGVGTITITNSTVTANGGSKAAGIGAMFWNNVKAINISGNSNVTAQGGSSSAGIGTSREGNNGVSTNIVISNSTVNATGGAYGAGIGAGYNNDSLGNGANASALPETSITISGGTVTATGGEGGAGIGGGYKGDNVDIDITGGTVTAVAGPLVSGKTVENGGAACGIGSGANGSGKFENSPKAEIGSNATVKVTAYYGGKVAIEGMTNEEADALSNVVVTEDGKPVPVAKIGEVEYTSLQAAVEAAQDGDTITVIASHNLDCTAITNDSLIYVSGDKAITIDLNGCTVTADYTVPEASEYQTVDVIIGVAAGSKLTLTDRSAEGTGTLHGKTTKETAKLECLVASFANSDNDAEDDGYSLIIDGGNYRIDYGVSGGAIVYSSADKTTLVSGGNFSIGNAGEESNDSPWMFNVRSQDANRLIVTGGTFNADINHQHYEFEVSISRDLALKKIGESTWTVVDAAVYLDEYHGLHTVYKVGMLPEVFATGKYIRQVGYVSLAEAIAAANADVHTTDSRPSGVNYEKITLLEGCTVGEAPIDISENVVLDLNGKTFDGTLRITVQGVKLTAPESLNVVSGVEGYAAFYNDGAWTLAPGYTVSFEPNGGSTVQAQAFEGGDTGPATKPTDPTKPGYAFAGWYSDADLTAVYNFSAEVTDDITLYAKWTLIDPWWTVVYNTNGGSTIENDTYTYGEAVTKPADPTRAGYTFAGWFCEETLETEYAFTGKAEGNEPVEMPLFAKWTQNPVYSGGSSYSSGSYAVTTEKAENGSIKVSPSRADAGDTVTITVTPNKGYELDTLTVTDKNGDAVKVTEKNGEYTFEMPKGKVTVEATFAEITELPFTDVAEDFWAVDEIIWAYDEGLMNGTSADTFNPGGKVTRQQVWMILARMAGYAPEDMAAAKGWAVATGVSDGSNPGDPVTRQQLVTLIWRAAGEPEGDVSILADYPDAASVSAYAQEAMAWAIENGVIGGTTQGTLNPAGNANRAQLAVILYRYVG